jgi:malate dehydrogenase
VSRIVIFGAGDLGAETARRLAAADVAASVALVDDQTTVAQGKALDIAQAAPVERYTTRLSGTSDVSAVVGAAVVIFADRAEKPATEWRDEAGLSLVRRVAGLNQSAPFIFAGVSQCTIIDRAVSELGVARERLIGSAAEALRSAVVAMVALEAGTAPADVSLMIVGRVPHTVIVSWDDATAAGQPLTRLLSAARLARLDQRTARLWPPGPYALAAAAARLVRTMLARLPHTHAATVALTREEGTPGRRAMLPVTLGPRGITRVLRPELAARDRVRLDNVLRS